MNFDSIRFNILASIIENLDPSKSKDLGNPNPGYF